MNEPMDTIARLSSEILMLGFLFSLLVALPILLLRRLRWEKSEQAYRPLFVRLRLFHEQRPGTVHVKYTVYQGLLFWVTQSTFDVYGPPEDAEEFLTRCLKFSLRRGLLAAGGLLIPVVLFPSHWAQRRSVRRQISDLTEEERLLWPPLTEAHCVETEEVQTYGKLPPWSSIFVSFLTVVIAVALVGKIVSSVVLRDTSDLSEYAVLGVIAVTLWGVLAYTLTMKQ